MPTTLVREPLDSGIDLRDTPPTITAPEPTSEAAKESLAKAFLIVAAAFLAVFLFTVVLMWFSSGGHLAGSIGVGLYSAAWGGIGFGAMVAAVSYTDK